MVQAEISSPNALDDDTTSLPGSPHSASRYTGNLEGESQALRSPAARPLPSLRSTHGDLSPSTGASLQRPPIPTSSPENVGIRGDGVVLTPMPERDNESR